MRNGSANYIYSIYLALVVVFLSCEPEIKLEAPDDDTLVVYCLINPLNSVHYLKITHSFLNVDGQDILEMAKDSTNIGFDKPFEVWVEKWLGGKRQGHPIKFFQTNDLIKEPGLFTTGKNCLYKTARDLEPGYLYRLFIYDPGYQQTLTASCYPISIPNIDLEIDNTFSIATIESMDSVYFYQIELYFNFVEVSQRDTIYKTILLSKHQKSNPDKTKGTPITLSLNRPNIFQIISNSISTVGDVKRYALQKPYEYKLTIGDEVVFDYQMTNNPNSQNLQTINPISNINGGIGLFASVYRKSIMGLALPDYWFVGLSQNEELLEFNFQPYPWNE